MFDKLIVSEPEGADFKNRKSYFIVSGLVVGVFFCAAVVVSIFASDFRLGATSFELVEMIAPPEMAPIEPRPQQPRLSTSSAPAGTTSAMPTRRENIARTDEMTVAPTSISVAPNNAVARPPGRFNIGPLNGDPGPRGSNGRPSGTGDDGMEGLRSETRPVVAADPIPEPPPVKNPVPVQPPAVKSMGVINGMATSLPKPEYPAPAKAVNAMGKVDVQVTIDEQGKVLSARAMSGHVLLRRAAENAARGARFTPTYLSKVPIKVTGVIVYNFTRG